MALPRWSNRIATDENAWRKQLTVIMDTCSVGISVLDPEGRITFANPEAARILGVTRTALVGKRPNDPIWELTAPDGRPFPVEERAFARTLQTKKRAPGVELTVRRPDGTSVAVSETATPIRREEGRIIGIVVSFMDITKRRQAEAELKSNLRFFESIGAINNLISAETKLDRMMSRVLDLILDVFKCDRAWLLFPADPEATSWRVPMERTRPEYPGAFALNQEVPMVPEAALAIRTALETKGPVVYDKRAGRPVPKTIAKQFAVKSQIVEAIYPKLGKPWMFGLHQCSDQRIWSDEDIRLFHEIGYRISDSLSNLLSFQTLQKSIVKRKKTEQKLKSAYESAKRARGDAEILATVAARISQTLELDQVLDGALDEVLSALGIGHGCIYVFDETGKLVIRAQRQLSRAFIEAKEVIGPGEGCAGTAAVTREMFAPTKEERRFVCKDSERLLDLDCLTAIPIVARGETLGVLELFAPVTRRLSARERAMSQAIANQLAVALQNARVFEEQRHIADTLQRALLTVPEKIQGIDLGHLYRSATIKAGEVGGDFYDLFELEHGRIAIVIGDVSGKGLEAASWTALAKHTIRAHAYEVDSPAAVVERANEVFVKASPQGMFATVLYAILDTQSGILTYCRAGHTPALLKKAGRVLTLDDGSPAAGIFAGLEFRDNREIIEKGDILVLYTDGVIEARHRGEFFGQQRLAALLRDKDFGSAKEVPQAIFDQVTSFARGQLRDDVAILAVSLS